MHVRPLQQTISTIIMPSSNSTYHVDAVSHPLCMTSYTIEPSSAGSKTCVCNSGPTSTLDGDNFIRQFCPLYPTACNSLLQAQPVDSKNLSLACTYRWKRHTFADCNSLSVLGSKVAMMLIPIDAWTNNGCCFRCTHCQQNCLLLLNV